VFNDAVSKWFADATTYSLKFLSRDVQPEEVTALRMAMVASFNSLELMIGQLPTKARDRKPCATPRNCAAG
jgi:hypothetical protein